MDCRTAREILDVLRPGSNDRAEPDVADAVAHLDECDECTLAFRWVQSFDRRIGRAMRDVPVPAGLKERLQDVLGIERHGTLDDAAGGRSAAEALAVPAAEDGLSRNGSMPAARTLPPTRRPSRRRWWTPITAMAAVFVLLGVVWFLNRDRGPQITLAQVYEKLPFDLSTAEPFDGSFDPQLPPGWAGNRLFIDRSPKGSDLGLGGQHVVAVYGFRFRGRDGTVIEGLLAVAPAGVIDAGRPLARSFAGAESDYPMGRTPRVRQLAGRAWSTGDFACVCLVPAERVDELVGWLELPIG
ncbi:MAG TPA: hypothetical protein VML55_14685 [Planctomycetaceae bacterium]|nr:hypothetical protein [Planctomycetaceae bacterium]